MKTHLLSSIAILLALTSISDGQTRWRDLTPEQQSARIEAIREARRQRIRAERLAMRQQAREAGREEARATRSRDRAFMAVWNGLTPEVRSMANARELAERLANRPEWQTQTRAQRTAAATAFITNYPAIKAARPQLAMNTALGSPAAAYPGKSDVALQPTQMQPSTIPAFPDAEVPDLFTINRRFNWAKPHGQWMNQMLKDIDAAKAAGNTTTYDDLTKRYAAWADQYLREER